jgi:hypothetical protein
MTTEYDWKEIGDHAIYELGTYSMPRHAVVFFGEGGSWVWKIKWEFVNASGLTHSHVDAMREASAVWNALNELYQSA